MKTIIKVFWCILVLAVSAGATNYTVKSGGGGNYTTIQACANAAVNPGDTCTVFAGTYNEYPTLSHSGTGKNGVCASCITFTNNPGDTVRVYGFKITGNYITVNGFLITDPSCDSTVTAVCHTSGAGIMIWTGTVGVKITNNTVTEVGYVSPALKAAGYPCISMQQGASSYTTITGNTISWCSSHPSQGILAQNVVKIAGTGSLNSANSTLTGTGPNFSSDLQVGDMIWVGNGKDQARQIASIKGPGSATLSQVPYQSVARGTIYAARGLGNANRNMATGVNLQGNHILFDNNNISHVSNGITVGTGHHIVIRGTTFHDVYDGAVSVTTQGGNPPQYDSLGANEQNTNDTHVDYMSAAGGGNDYILIESNTALRIWGTQGAHGWFASRPARSATSSFWIDRFNKFYQMGSAYLGNEVATSAPKGVDHWKSYNNSYIKSQQQSATGAGGNYAGCAPTQGAGALSDQGYYWSFINNLFYNDVNPSGTAHVNYYAATGQYCDGVTGGFRGGSNLAFDSSCSPSTLANCTTGQMASDPGNIYFDPKLVATDGTSFALQAGSPAIGAGTYLTTASGSGSSSTSLTVADATYFQDGWGISGVQADWIRIGSSTTVQISSVNYSTRVITLAKAVSWNNNDPVYLYKDSSGRVVLNGANPNIGAGGTGGTGGASPPAPSRLGAVVH
jgi:hypothetical protein